MTLLDSTVLSGHNSFGWIQSTPPSASHLCMKLGVDCWLYGPCRHSAPDELQPWQLTLATIGGYWWPDWSPALPNQSPVTCYLTFPSSSPSDPHLHIFKNISTHCYQINSIISTSSKGSHFLNLTEQSETVFSHRKGPSRCGLKRFCSCKMDRCFLFRNLATAIIFHLFKVLKLGFHLLFANRFKENSVSLRLIGASHLAPPVLDVSLLSSSALYLL